MNQQREDRTPPPLASVKGMGRQQKQQSSRYFQHNGFIPSFSFPDSSGTMTLPDSAIMSQLTGEAMWRTFVNSAGNKSTNPPQNAKVRIMYGQLYLHMGRRRIMIRKRNMIKNYN